MDKNTITGFVLIALVLIGFSWWSRPSEEQLREMARQDSIAQVRQIQAQEALEKERLAEKEQKLSAVDSTSAFFANSFGEGKLVTLDNGKVAVTLNTKGGLVERAVLHDYKNQQGEGVILLTPEDGRMTFALAGKNENFTSDGLVFDVVAQTATTATFRATAANGGVLDLKYKLHPNSYMLDFIIESDGLQNLFAPSMNAIDFTW